MKAEDELLRGCVKAWDDAKGYGFIEPSEEGRDVFFHIKQWTQKDERPRVGKQVFYLREDLKHGKARASLVRPLSAAKVTEEAVAWRSLLKGDLGILVLIAACILILIFGLIIGAPLEVGAAYGVSSILSYRLYKSDKLSAGKRYRRVPELTLHLCDFLCGWPGGLVAQQRLRHKTIKSSFQIVFWLIVVTNLFLAAIYIFIKNNTAVLVG